MSYQFVPPNSLNTPVLFLVFNRIDTTKKVFEAIREARPPRLYIGADGARNNKIGEKDKVETVRSYILQNIDWECEVKTLFRDENLGCKLAVSSAISWFFENEEQGIILEDDCLPCQSFFWYCEELLQKYKDDSRIWHISGNNFQDGVKRGDGDYYFSKYNHIWGWASWANRWKSYDVGLNSLDQFIKNNGIKDVFINKKEQKFWISQFTSVANGNIDTWDYQWSYCVFVNSGLSVLPNKNLISNIGFGADATHTFDIESKLANISTANLSLPLKPPSFLMRDECADEYTGIYHYRKRSLLVRILKRLI